MAELFRARLAAAIARRGPLCAGIDPSLDALEQWGLPDSASGAAEFSMRVYEAVRDDVSIIKPNVAFFEQFGAAGLSALEALLAAARHDGMLSLVDAKRGDIASTNAAYARAWLRADAPMATDAITVAPYLGLRALYPFFDAAEQEGRGVFVVARSSNAEGRDVQLATTQRGQTLEAAVLDEMATRPGTVGAVIGLLAGYPPLELPESGFYLAPGLGAQGATVADLAAQFGGMASTPVVANLSRALDRAGPDARSVQNAAVDARAEIARGLLPSAS
jgi:orotidine-5'-phosphate decarboxylase